MWRDEYKAIEQDYMVLKDQYAELARALGFPGDAWFGDPLASHSEVVARAIEAAELREQLATAHAQLAKARAALTKIERWHGEFPPTGEFWSKSDGTLSDRPMSYAACYGSNGERDYMRSVARQGLTP